MFIPANLLSVGDAILEQDVRGKTTRRVVKRRRFDNVGCRGIHVDIQGGGTWCYHASALVEVAESRQAVAA